MSLVTASSIRSISAWILQLLASSNVLYIRGASVAPGSSSLPSKGRFRTSLGCFCVVFCMNKGLWFGCYWCISTPLTILSIYQKCIAASTEGVWILIHCVNKLISLQYLTATRLLPTVLISKIKRVGHTVAPAVQTILETGHVAYQHTWRCTLSWIYLVFH